MRQSRRAALVLLAGLSVLGAGCVGDGSVTRLAGGELRVGPAVPIRAYEAFLKGAIAEERREMDVAAREYRAALAWGPDDPEVWSRLGTVLCTGKPAEADRAFSEAFELDSEFESALVRRAECAQSRGRKADFSPAFRVSPRRIPTAARAVVDGEALFALTVVYGEQPVVWDALADYASAHGDARTEVRALAMRATQDAAGRTRALARAHALAAQGALHEARALSAAAVDARAKVGPDPTRSADSLSESALRAVYILSLDDAIARGDAAALRRRAARTHVGLEEAAARALAAGEGALARELASAVAEADPASATARLVVALAALMTPGAGGAGSTGAGAPVATSALASLPRATRRVPAALAVVLAERVLAAGGKDAARHVLEGLARDEVLGNDVLLVPRLVDLVVAGAAPEAMLPVEGLVELAVREGGAPRKPPSRLSVDAPIDAPHAYLRAALFAPSAEATRALRARVASAHPAVVVGDVLVELAARAAGGQGQDVGSLLPRLVAAGHGTMLLGARVELLRARGDTEGAAHAQTLLAAHAPLTEREQALASRRPSRSSAAVLESPTSTSASRQN